MKPDKKEILESIKITDFLGIKLNQPIISPLRPEAHPSFNVFMSKHGHEVWKDHGTGEFGDVIKLYQLLNGCDFQTACRELASDNYIKPVISNVPSYGRAAKTQKTAAESLEEGFGIRSLTPVSKSRYIQYTALPVPSWLVASADLYTDQKYNLCVPNVSGGIHIKGGLSHASGKTYAKNIGHADISVFGNPLATTWCVVEGVGDLLALVDGVGDQAAHERGEYMYIVLNSANNLDSCIDNLKAADPERIELYLDNDKQGNIKTAKLLELFTAAVDCRSIITYGKDLRDTWSRQLQNE